MAVSIVVNEKAFISDEKRNVVIDDISLEIKQGEFLTIIGPSGCGKSTLLKIIAGLDTDYMGKVHIENRRIVEPGINQGFIFQEHRLFPWLTVEQNIAADLNLRDSKVKQKVAEIIQIVRLDGYEKAYPSALSGGMSQRVAIARALIREPEVLLLDEPFGALDAFTRKHLQDVLLQIWQKKKITMILVTHDIDESIYLGTKLAILRSKPGALQKVMPIKLSFPRNRTDSSFQYLRQEVLKEFEKTKEVVYEQGSGI
ncbi:ABC transporter ATP-binding protein [Priestia filamentosa]|uniref:Sulfonate ABC transporter ATP-binding protein n=1 Tax=Priestia filamentosa TaxID=1402861 RepID=A0A1X7CPY4_9BACI|nr:ABC transporter ATP-binding protein [Priestia filamentosa]AKO94468.1 sulfonate ABC transporter ATP-binding protein [Priestia filamentosa]MDT3764762.1 ABC transporter ATP-binding protein [Priestia filamentosa]OXS70795.1 sulfonate ABC transporter ATP-binding protein [Priestia filamentosa]RJS66427.1 sulfonate ABC transporter ATP-binding protein [Priestia filamentosa]WCM15364.1 ABC transporter ATP-binding protein [Priestia filamentosa]